MRSVCSDCRFDTEHLAVHPWHLLANDRLTAFVSELLTPGVTRALPDAWQGDYDLARAEHWVAERDAECTPLLVTEARVPIGLLLLYEEIQPEGGIVVRLGYMLAERAWGRGLGTELIGGLVAWSRMQPPVRTLVGGVAADNPASIRTLVRNGFEPAATTADGEQEYRLDL